jgi:hypothetical protein
VSTARAAGVFALVVMVLAVIASVAPAPSRQTDRDIYEATANQFIVPDCSDLHCFRVLVAWTLGVVPGPSAAKWKAFAVIANATGAIGVLALGLAWGLSLRASLLATAMSATGFGSLYTLYDPFTSDPLMYALGPILVWLLLHDRVAVAGAVAAVGVLAKEFAAAPMMVFAGATAMGGRGWDALRVLAAANVALIVWLALQLVLVIGYNYTYADSSSTHLMSGGYLRRWLETQSWRVSLSALYGEFGMLWLLAPVGLLLAPAPVRRFAIAAIPVALVFGYVQQPDRAFWNFHFVVVALGALVLDKAPPVVAWSAVAAFALANLRLGAQLPFAPPARLPLAVSAALACACLYFAFRRSSVVAVEAHAR